MDAVHKILTNKKSSDWKMWLSLVVTYTGFAVLTLSNGLLLLRIAKNPKFDSQCYDAKLLIIDAVDSIH
jgi:hypothetical protein